MANKINVKLINEKLGTNYKSLNWEQFKTCEGITEAFLKEYLQDIRNQLGYSQTFNNFLEYVLTHNTYSIEFVYSTFKYGYYNQFTNHKFPENIIEKWINEYNNQVIYQLHHVFHYQKVSEAFIEKYFNLICDNKQETRINAYVKEICIDYILRYQNISEAFIEKYFNVIKQSSVCKYVQLSSQFIEKHWDKFIEHINYIITYQQLDFPFIEKHWNDLLTFTNVYNQPLLFKYQSKYIPLKVIEKQWHSFNKSEILSLLQYYKLPVTFLEYHLEEFNINKHYEYLYFILNYQELTEDFIIYLIDTYLINTNASTVISKFLDQKCITDKFIELYINKFFTWKDVLNSNSLYNLSESLLIKYFDNIAKCKCNKLFYRDNLSINFIEHIAPKMNKEMWKALSNSEICSTLSIEFIEKYKDKIVWDYDLVNNLSANNLKKFKKFIPLDMLVNAKHFKEFINTCNIDEVKSILFNVIEYV